MRYPKFLQPGGKIGIIAPSFGACTEPYRSRFESAVGVFFEAGYETVIGANCFESSGAGKSSSPEACGAEINDFFLNGRSDVIISCGGGETMCEDLPFVDFEGISKSEPRWFMGFSDNTNLTFTLPVLCDTAAIYGPCAPAFGRLPLHSSLEDALQLLEGKKLEVKNYEFWEKEGCDSEAPLSSYNLTEPFGMKVSSPGGEKNVSLSGRLIGGCLDCLQVLCGTEFDRVHEFSQKYRADGIIWFIESCDLTAFGVRRALWQLDNAGWFENAVGFLIGRPLRPEEDSFSAVSSVLEKYNKPIIFDLDIGHLPPMMPLISGALAQIQTAENSFSIKFSLE